MQEAISALQDRVNKYNNEGYVESWSLTVGNVKRRSHNNDDNNDDELDIVGREWEQNDRHQHGQDDSLWWNRFMTILSQEVSQTQLEGIRFLLSFLDRPNDPVLERLFRDVLPNLSSLTELDFMSCQILPTYMDNFLTSLITNHNNNNNNVNNLRTRRFWGTQLDSSSVAALARLLSCAKYRSGPLIEELWLDNCSIDSDGCELILNALDGNTCLTRLDLSRNNISEISLGAARVLGNCKNLRVLSVVRNPYSDQSECHLAEGLRTNHSLERLHLEDKFGVHRRRQIATGAFAELLKTFNYSLQEVSGIQELPGKEKLLLQNQRIRRLLDDLLERNCNSSSNTTTASTGSYQLQQLYLWPLALECIGSKPSLIYHFVRQGNLESFTDQVLLAGSSNDNLSKSIRKSKEAEESKLDNNTSPPKKSRGN